jgi:hypothetical protein
VIAAVAAGAVVADERGVFDRDGASSGTVDNGSATSLATITRRSLSEQTQLNGVLGYARSFTVLGQERGTVTWLPAPGRVIHDGQVLYRVDQAPVTLLYGTTPAYRALAVGATGADVSELNHDLVSLGFVQRSEVDDAWDDFAVATADGVATLQHHLGVEQTGSLPLGEVVFLPTAARITSLNAVLGGPATGPVMTASSTVPTVTVALDPSLQSEVAAGDRVTITLPNGANTPGVVTSVGTVATEAPSDSGGGGGPGGADSGPTVSVQIRPARMNAADHLDQALVEVAITDRVVHDALAVPVGALLARAGGGYAVEVVATDGVHQLIPVTPGLFDDAAGEVQISGSGLASGQRVVVPGQ